MLAIMRPNKLYETAYNLLGTDVSPQDNAPDELGCMDSVSRLIQKAYPEIHFPTILSTKKGFDYFSQSPYFEEIQSPMTGAIMMAVTGTGAGTIKNGHIAVCGKKLSPDRTLWAMSNDSRSGLWEVNYSVGSFTRYFNGRGKMPVRFFRIV